MPQTDKKGEYNRPLSSDEIQQVVRRGIKLSICSFAFMGLLFFLVASDTIKLYPSTMKSSVLEAFALRVEYALRYQTLLVTWLLFNVMFTIYGRLTMMAINPLDQSSEEKVQMHKNILTNSFEQILISVMAQLIFVNFTAPDMVLKFIPLVNIIQFIGRIAFFYGYPMSRAFGFQCTVVPNIVLVFFNVINFVAFITGS